MNLLESTIVDLPSPISSPRPSPSVHSPTPLLNFCEYKTLWFPTVFTK